MMEKIIDVDLTGMSFSEAMQNFLEKKKIRRKIWTEGDYCQLQHGVVLDYFSNPVEPEEKFKHSDEIVASLDDILACDWEVLE